MKANKRVRDLGRRAKNFLFNRSNLAAGAKFKIAPINEPVVAQTSTKVLSAMEEELIRAFGKGK